MVYTLNVHHCGQWT